LDVYASPGKQISTKRAAVSVCVFEFRAETFGSARSDSLHLDPETLWLEQVEAKEVRKVKVEEVLDELFSRGGQCLQDDLIKAMGDKLGAKERSTRDAIYEARDKELIEAGYKGQKRVWILKQKDVGK